jgi:hypothetical protein
MPNNLEQTLLERAASKASGIGPPTGPETPLPTPREAQNPIMKLLGMTGMASPLEQMGTQAVGAAARPNYIGSLLPKLFGGPVGKTEKKVFREMSRAGQFGGERTVNPFGQSSPADVEDIRAFREALRQVIGK